jgi:MFS family permease
MARYPTIRGKGLVFLLFLWLLWFLNFNMRTIFSPLLPIIEDEFLVNHARATSILTTLAVGYGSSLFLAGLFAGRFGYRRTILTSFYVSSAVFLCMPFVNDFRQLYWSSFVIGLSMGAYMPSIIPLIAESFSEEHWGTAIVVHDCAAPIAIFATPFIALCLLHFTGWRWIFILYAGLFIVAATAFGFLSQEVKIRPLQKVAIGALVKNRSLWILGTLSIVAVGVNLGIYCIVPLYLTKELLLDIGFANTILGISRLGGIVIAVVTGFFINRLDLQKAISFILLISGILTILLGFVSARFTGLVLFFQTTCVTVFFPISLVLTAKVFSRETRGMAMGVLGTISSIVGVGFIPYFLGLSGDLVSFRFGIILLGVLAILSSWLPRYVRSPK